MRSPGLLFVLIAILVFAPVVQAQSCFCASASGQDDLSGESTCCCGDAASCCCTDCDAHAATDQEGGAGTLAGCVCTKTQPQSSPDPQDNVALDEGRSHNDLLPVPDPRQPTLLSAPTLEGDLRPPSYRPLLV